MTILIEETKPSVRMTVDEFERLPEWPNYELVDGFLKEKHTGAESDWIAATIAAILRTFVQQRKVGFVFPETGYRMKPKDSHYFRKPDVSFVALGRLEGDQLPRGYMSLAPDLAIEVLSPNDLVEDVDEKVGEYLRFGVKLVWVVHPITRTVFMYSSDGRILGFSENQMIDGGEVLPGFSSPVKDFFPPIENTTLSVPKSDV